MHRFDLALLVLRLCVGLFLPPHGLNKLKSLAGTARWFGSIGMRSPALQARLAATTEITTGLMLAAGLLTPLAAAGMIGLMLVTIATVHRFNGFFIIKEGWEYTAMIAVVALCIAALGPGRWSLDNAIGLHFNGYDGAWIAGGVGVVGAAVHLALFYRPGATRSAGTT